MALEAQDNPFPSVLLRETVDPANPSAGDQRLFIDTDHILKLRDSAGVVTEISSTVSAAAHIADTSAAHAASSIGFTPNGSIAATDVQAAIQEVRDEAAGGSVATDSLWDAAGDLAVGSGANTAAKLTMGAEGSALTVMDGVVGWNSATSMPAGPTTGQRVWRSDLAMEFYFDGTRWLSTTLYNAQPTFESLPPHSASTAARIANPSLTLNIWVVSFWSETFVQTTNSGTQYWTITLDATSTVLSTISNTAGALTRESASVGAQISTGASAWITFTVTKVSTPGTAFLPTTFNYRFIGV